MSAQSKHLKQLRRDKKKKQQKAKDFKKSLRAKDDAFWAQLEDLHKTSLEADPKHKENVWNALNDIYPDLFPNKFDLEKNNAIQQMIADVLASRNNQ